MKKANIIQISAFLLTLVLNQNIKAMQKYNKLTIVEINNVFKSGKIRTVATCECDCGKFVDVVIDKIKSGHTKSCGCYKIEAATKHGLHKHPLRAVYYAMLYRCHPKRSNNPKYSNYAGRSISVCEEWQDSFLTFYNWCYDNGWRKGLEIDRKDNNGNYTPENCRIVEKITNTNNRRNTLWTIYRGEKRLVKEVCRELGVNYKSVGDRIAKGIPDDQIFNIRPTKKRFTDNDVREMARLRETGMPYYKIAAKMNTQKSSIMYSLKERKLQS